MNTNKCNKKAFIIYALHTNNKCLINISDFIYLFGAFVCAGNKFIHHQRAVFLYLLQAGSNRRRFKRVKREKLRALL